MKTQITVFTPTYNRKWILNNAYESLCKQNYDDFEWIIMDDGSNDDTKSLVSEWIKENKIKISYYYQENQGRFAAFNNAKKYFLGELVITLDSDDYLLENALLNVHEFWVNVSNKEYVSGIVAHFETTDNKLLGSKFPKGLKQERLYILYDKYRITGDKVLVFRKDLIDVVEYPIYKGERFGGDSIIFNKMNDIYPMRILDKTLSHREYQSDSITNNLKQHHLASKNGIRDKYLDNLKHERYNKLNIIKHTIGYISYGKMTRYTFKELYKHTPYKILFTMLYLPAIIYKYYLLRGDSKI